MATISLPQRHGMAAAQGLSALVASTRQRIAVARQRRARFNRTLNELTALSDRDLNDIGIPRCDIRRVAWLDALKD